jgi:hypothetical protein
MKKRNIALDIVLTLLLCGLWNMVVQYEQINTLNAMYREEKYSFWKMYLFTILTCGLYLIYFEYKKATDFIQFSKPGEEDGSEGVIAVVLTLFGLNFIYDAILQSKINHQIDQTIGTLG